MASIQSTPAGGFRVSVCKRGKRDTRTFPPGTLHKDAKDWGITREAEIIAGVNVGPPKEERSVRQLIEAFKKGPLLKRPNSLWELGRCNWLLKNLPFLDTPLRALELEEVEEWIIDRSLVVIGSTVNRDLQLLGPIFKWGITRKKWLDSNPIHLSDWPKNNKPRRVRISDKDADAIIAALGYVRGTSPLTKGERLAVAFLLALETGMRRGEMLKTVWRNVHDDYVHLPGAITKNRHERDVPLSPAAKVLVALIPRHDEALFGGLAPDTADSLFRAARKVAKLHGLHFHDTRHEAVTRLARRLELPDLAEMIGHRDYNSLRTYYNPTPQEIAARLAARPSTIENNEKNLT